MPNYGTAKLNNHIQTAAPGTLAAMGKLFGIGQDEFLAAVYGDPGAIKKIADLGRLSQTAKDNIEKALEATRLTIETTGDVNAALADLARLSHKSGTQIMRSIYDARLAEKKMANELVEMRDRRSTAGIHLFARLGIPALASGTLGGIVIALCFGNALTQVRIDGGKPYIDGEFFLALFQALGVTGAMWVGARDYRQLAGISNRGRNEFLTEVKNFEIKPSSPDFGRLGTAGIGLLLLLVAIALLKGGKDSGY